MSGEKFSLPILDLELEVYRLIRHFGAEAVRDEVAKATKKKRSRKPEKDWPLLEENRRLDANDWLEGRDPFNARSNYAVAKRFSEQHPGQSAISTMERIERKLKARRYPLMLSKGCQIAKAEYPFAVYLRVLETSQREKTNRETWAAIYKSDCQRIEEYRSLIGEPPSEMSFDALEAAVIENRPKFSSEPRRFSTDE
jgi:hypothetical protein